MENYTSLTNDQINNLINNTKTLMKQFNGKPLLVYHYQNKIEELRFELKQRK